MKYSVEKVDFWSGEIRDEVGGLAAGLRPLVDAGSNFVFVIARRQPDKPGSGHVFLGGISGAKQSKAAKAAGFERADMPGLRIQAPDKAGTVEAIVAQMAAAGINLRGVSASAPVRGARSSWPSTQTRTATKLPVCSRVLRRQSDQQDAIVRDRRAGSDLTSLATTIDPCAFSPSPIVFFPAVRSSC